jgi:hypothetical protein
MTVGRPPREIVAVGAIYALATVAVAVTYTRLPARELYHVSGTGLAAGLGRALVFLNFSTAIAAIGVALVCLPRLSRALLPLGVIAIVLCAVVAWPGVVDQANLEAKAANALPAIGVALVAGLALVAAVPRAPRYVRGDGLRLGVAAVAIVIATPWIAAELGFYLDGVPLLGWLFQTGRTVGDHPAVHHGHHHGTDGLLLALTALALSRLLPVVGSRVASVYLALLLAYGLANLANDFWGEQIVERGLTSRAFPNVLQPHASFAWLGVLLAGLAFWALWFRRLADE